MLKKNTRNIVNNWRKFLKESHNVDEDHYEWDMPDFPIFENFMPFSNNYFKDITLLDDVFDYMGSKYGDSSKIILDTNYPIDDTVLKEAEDSFISRELINSLHFSSCERGFFVFNNVTVGSPYYFEGLKIEDNDRKIFLIFEDVFVSEVDREKYVDEIIQNNGLFEKLEATYPDNLQQVEGIIKNAKISFFDNLKRSSEGFTLKDAKEYLIDYLSSFI
jgi:hypothetical protein